MKKKYQLALITGASTGLGKALAIALSARGIPLLLAARREDKLREVAKELSVATQIYVVDLHSAQERQEFLKWIRLQSPDLIINNAGAGLYGPMLDHTPSQQSGLVELNAQALLEITLEGARTLLQQKRSGTIMNISSAAAFFQYPSNGIYAASKAFVNHFSQTLNFELKKHNIRILTSCPGQIDTEFSLKASGYIPHKKSKLLTMSSQKAAMLILKQIDQGKMLKIIDWRYKLLVLLSRFIPNAILIRILNTTLRDRHT